MFTDRISVQITERQTRWLDSESRRLGISVAEVIRRVLDDRIDAEQRAIAAYGEGLLGRSAAPPPEVFSRE